MQERYCPSADCNILIQPTTSQHRQEGSSMLRYSEASLPGLVDLIICFIIRDMVSRRSSLVFGRHHPSRSVHSDSVPSFRRMIFCRLKSSKREGNISLLHSDVGFNWDRLWLTSILLHWIGIAYLVIQVTITWERKLMCEKSGFFFS